MPSRAENFGDRPTLKYPMVHHTGPTWSAWVALLAVGEHEWWNRELTERPSPEALRAMPQARARAAAYCKALDYEYLTGFQISPLSENIQFDENLWGKSGQVTDHVVMEPLFWTNPRKHRYYTDVQHPDREYVFTTISCSLFRTKREDIRVRVLDADGEELKLETKPQRRR
jgi:hypothetical protein